MCFLTYLSKIISHLPTTPQRITSAPSKCPRYAHFTKCGSDLHCVATAPPTVLEPMVCKRFIIGSFQQRKHPEKKGILARGELLFHLFSCHLLIEMVGPQVEERDAALSRCADEQRCLQTLVLALAPRPSLIPRWYSATLRFPPSVPPTL